MKKLLFLGPEGSYTQLAMNKASSILDLSEYEIEPISRINNIICEIDNNPDFIGIVPIENSIEGIVQETVDKLVRTQNYIRILQEIIIPISHCLSNISGDISKVKTIISHPQALAQCNGYIHELSKTIGRNIEIMPYSSTAQAVKSLDNYDETFAAIASFETAKLYNRQVLATQINDEKDNKTRFVCIGNNYPHKTGNDITSVAFTTLNKPGALVDVLSVLKEHKLNMSHIDSRPSKKVLGEYMFYIDIDGHIEDENVKAAFEKIKSYTTFYRLLGAYPKYVEAK